MGSKERTIKTVAKKVLRAEKFIPEILVPLITLCIYCGAFVFLSSRYLIERENFFFVSYLLKYIFFLLLILMFFHSLFFIQFYIINGNQLKISHSTERFSINDLILILLPLTPILNYLINNRDELIFIESFFVIGFFVLFSSILVLFIPILFRKIGSLRTITTMGLALTFTITSMASLSSYSNWFDNFRIEIPMLFFGVSLLIVWILSNDKAKRILHTIIIINFLISSLSPIFAGSGVYGTENSTHTIDENKFLSYIDGRKPNLFPNIYFLVYESYVSNETMLGYGINNDLQENYLRSVGFKIYPGIYSVGSPTLRSMSRVFNASQAFNGPKNRAASGDGIVQNSLRELGYETYGLFPNDFLFFRIGSSYDYSIPKQLTSEESSDLIERLTKAILIGAFKFDLFVYNEMPRDQFIVTKHRIINNILSGPIFMYTHSELPGHSRFSGGCRTDEINLYSQNLEKANNEMRQDIDLISKKDPTAIIIIAGDHGPYLTKSCFNTSKEFDKSEISRLDIQDRFGTFLAIKWPGEEFSKLDDFRVLQDLFPVIFAYLYDDIKFLDLRITPEILDTYPISGVSVKNGIIVGGINDGEPLFILDQ